jgi:hypothetical protein
MNKGGIELDMYTRFSSLDVSERSRVKRTLNRLLNYSFSGYFPCWLALELGLQRLSQEGGEKKRWVIFQGRNWVVYCCTEASSVGATSPRQNDALLPPNSWRKKCMQ